MKQFLAFFIVILLNPIHLFSQDGDCTFSVVGKVLDKDTNAPIPFATIRVAGVEKFTNSDKDGNFVIEGLCTEANTLIISCIGYAEATQDHQHHSDVHFYLTQKVTGLDEVTIQAERIKEKGTETIAQVNVGEAVLKSDATQSLAAALSNIQGVTFTAAGTNVQLPVIHGLSGNRIVVLNNGIRHGFQNWGREHAPEIDINAANNVTVIKGASGVRFGPEALGGVILVEPTSLLLNQPLSASIGTSFQTNGSGANGNFEIAEGKEKWSYFLNGNYTRVGDRRTPEVNLNNTGKEEFAFSMGTLYHHKKWDFKLNYSFIDQNLGLLRGAFVQSGDAFIAAINADEPLFNDSFSYEIEDPNQEVQHHLAKAKINWWYSDTGRLSFIAGIQLNRRDEFDVRRNAELPIIDLDLITNDYQLEWKHPKWYGLDGLIGIQYFSQNNDNNPGTQTTAFIPNYNTERYSAFVLENLKFGKNTLEVGARIDFETNSIRGRELNQDIFRDDYNFTNLTASLGYVRKLSDDTTFRTNIGTAWRTPNVAELFSFGQNTFQTTFGLLRFVETNGTINTNEVGTLDNSNVEPETGFKFINELQINKAGNQHNFTAFGHYIDNYVFDRPIGVFSTFRGPMPGFIFDQTDALFLGLDYSWQKQWSDPISSVFGVSYLWSRNVERDESLIEQPPISLNLQLQWKQRKFWNLESSNVSLNTSYTFQQFQAPRTVSPESLINGTEIVTTASEIFDFIDAPDGYFLLDLAWNFGWKNLNGSIMVRNLLNTQYRNYLNDLRYFADEPGTNFIFSLNYQFNSKKNEN